MISLDDTLTPELLVEAAKDINHPLHDYFEWDDEKAAEMFIQLRNES